MVMVGGAGVPGTSINGAAADSDSEYPIAFRDVTPNWTVTFGVPRYPSEHD